MVKVISAYNFQQQNTYSTSGDIAATCLIESNRLAIAHRNHLIEILTLKRPLSSGKLTDSAAHDDRENVVNTDATTNNATSDDYREPPRCYIDQNDNCQPNKIAFPTIDQVEQMIYCAADNYLLTLEKKTEIINDRIVKQRTFVRAYTNFDIAGSIDDCLSVPIRARIASKTTPNTICNDHIEVIEILIDTAASSSAPHLVSCCQTAGTIGVCCEQQIHFFESRYRTNDANKFQFIDFFQAPFYVNLDFIPLKLSIAEHVVACMDSVTVVAFKIVDLSDIGTEDGTTTNSVEETDSSTNLPPNINQSHNYNMLNTNCKRNRTIDFQVAKQYNQANGITFQSDIKSNWDHENGRRSSTFTEDRPFLVNDVKIFLKNREPIASTNGRIFYSIRSLVQLRLYPENITNASSKQNQSQQQQQNCAGGGGGVGESHPNVGKSAPSSSSTTSIHDEFRCLALKPIYFKLNKSNIDEQQRQQSNQQHDDCGGIYDLVDKCSNADSGGHIMKSIYHTNCVGFSLFISTVSDGYVYQFTNQGKWYTENTKCLAVYPFTSPVVDIVIDNFVIHAITESGIETFSSRIGHKLFSSYFEYPMINDPYPNETSPLVDVPICVIGICGFFGIKHVAASSNNLILLTTADGESSMRRNNTISHKRCTATIATTVSRKNNNNTSSCLNSRGGGNGHQHITNNNANCLEIFDWTIYDLQLPKPQTIVDDIENLARIYRQSSPEIYYELVEEAHVIIRLAREIFIVPHCDRDHNNDSDKVALDVSYAKTCKMLADFTIQSNRKETYSQAIAYYSMCKQSIHDVYNSYHEINKLHNSGDHDHAGLMYTLTLFLSRIGSNKSAIQYLTQSLTKQCHCFDVAINNNNRMVVSDQIAVTTASDHTFVDELFTLYLKYAPTDLTHIALNSSVFREMLNDRLYTLYSSVDVNNLSPERKMCLILCLCYQNRTAEALNYFETFRRSHLYAVLYEYWPQILFDNYQSDNYRKCSFSDLTESILFLTEHNELIEAVADVLIRILAITHSIDLNFLIKLFMNYFAMNVGCRGYKTSQKILEIVLQAYFYDYYKYNSNRNVIMMSSNSGGIGPGEQRLQSPDVIGANYNWQPKATKTSIVAAAPTSACYSQRKNSSLLSDNSSSSTTTIDSNYDDPEFEAIKILCRMYLGLLKNYTDDGAQQQNRQDLTGILPDINGYRLAFIDFLYRNKTLIKSTHSKFDTNSLTNQQLQMQLAAILADYHTISTDNKSKADEDNYWARNPFHRPIVFFERRENFLNKMPPLCLKTDVNGVPFSNNWDDVSLVVIKVQSLLNCGKLDSSLIEDVITFIHSNPNVIGVDSLLTILLPKSEGIELLIHTNPQYLLDYAKVRLTTPIQWQVLFKRILSKKRELNPDNQQTAIELYDRVIEDILRDLVATKPLDEFLECIPEQELNRNEYSLDKDNSYWKLNKYRTQTQDGIDETNPFELIMREAVVKQRSEALDAMIQSSGRQLNDAVNSFQLNFN